MKSFPYPLGPSRLPNGVNFALYTTDANVVEIHFPDLGTSFPLLEKTGDIRHIFLPILENKINYFYSIDGSATLDPFAPEIKSSSTWGTPYSAVSQFSDLTFDWESTVRPQHKKEELIIYEMHVRGFTQDPSSRVTHPGTFLGLIEKIPYLIELGINTVELLPVHEFNEGEIQLVNPLTGQRLTNYWGYSPVSYFALMNRYAVQNAALEFKTLVRELHRAKIEVILDVVYNHTSLKESSSYNTLAKETYYIIEDGIYLNDTGCGNTLRCDHIITTELILRSLRFLAFEFQVDGFRFDLATILKLNSNALVKAISEDPILKDCKLIAEPWDAAHYEVGRFYPSSSRWSEWNDKYRDTVRSFIRGDAWKKGEFATRLAGSEDLYSTSQRPSTSVNFITVHDGFSLYDLVSYNQKHNLANGEDNRDGLNHNLSWNCGEEGPTKDPEIRALRLRQMKNFLLALFLSKGLPLLTMGDEYGHTKLGNNNSWCQDNHLSWFQWEIKSPLLAFVKKLIQLRKREKILTKDAFLTPHDIIWHGLEPHKPLWEIDNGFLAFTLGSNLYAAFNACKDFQTVTLPEGEWECILCTSEVFECRMEPYSAFLLKRR